MIIFILNTKNWNLKILKERLNKSIFKIYRLLFKKINQKLWKDKKETLSQEYNLQIYKKWDKPNRYLKKFNKKDTQKMNSKMILKKKNSNI